jgi:murein DD-endopeptidase MepM/ murein hydrolase activator NlpD
MKTIHRIMGAPANADVMYKWKARRWLEPSRLITPIEDEYPLAAAAGYELIYPMYELWPLTQGFHSAHPAVDYGMPSYTKLRASISGQLVAYGYVDRWYAYTCAIKNDALGLYVLYAHMPANGYNPDLRVGDWVKAGDWIGRSDNTGNSTGPHLHFEARRKPYQYGKDCFDPRPYFVMAPQPPQPPQPPSPPPPPQTGWPAWFEVVKPAGKLAVHVVPSKGGQVVKYYSKGQRVLVLEDYLETINTNDNWVRTADGYVLRSTTGKKYLKRI